jgi:hypothetical protein
MAPDFGTEEEQREHAKDEEIKRFQREINDKKRAEDLKKFQEAMRENRDYGDLDEPGW